MKIVITPLPNGGVSIETPDAGSNEDVPVDKLAEWNRVLDAWEASAAAPDEGRGPATGRPPDVADETVEQDLLATAYHLHDDVVKGRVVVLLGVAVRSDGTVVPFWGGEANWTAAEALLRLARNVYRADIISRDIPF